MSVLKKISRKIKRVFNKPLTSDDLNDILKGKDIIIGDKTVFFDPSTIMIDIQRPWLIKIGAYTKITRGTVILAHDYSRAVLRRVYGDILCEAGSTEIGENCFIGNNSIILMGTHIGNNVIVGAGSVVSGNIPDNVVIAGNPARVIRTLDEHYKIRKSKQVDEAKLCARKYYERYHKMPSIEEMGAFFPLYLERNIEALRKNNLKTKLAADNEDEVIKSFLESEPVYKDYETFLQDTFKDMK